MKKKFIKAGLILAAAALLAAGWFNAPTNASGARDCDSNAIIYCGAYTASELASDIKNGTGRSYQSGSQLTALFAHYGIRTSQFNDGGFKNGRVTKDNKVYVGDRVVATNVYSLGRHNTTGSIRETWASYPLYKRHPQYSFVSNSIDAFVYMNYDGTMAYAIIKSCGNIVPGVGVRTRPQPAPTYRLYAHKFIDANENGRYDLGERPQGGVTFRLTGNGIASRNAVSGTDGFAGFYGLLAGTYTITEYIPVGYHATTANPQSVRVTSDGQIVRFGNARNAVAVNLQIVKYEDINGNQAQDSGESLLSGWHFNVTGNGQRYSVVTDANGQVTINGIQAGRYTVTEVNQNGWESTTGLSQVHDVTTDPATQIFMFGNRRVENPTTTPTPGGGDVARPLPTSGPAEAAATAGATTTLFSGIFAWIKSKKRLFAAFRK